MTITRKLIRIAISTAVTAGCIMPFATATASQPEREHDSFEVSGTIDCSVFDSSWDFSDDFVDVFEVDRQYRYSRTGELVRIVEHWKQRSTDVNSSTGVTINEHNRFVVDIDLVGGTLTVSGALNNAQRRGMGNVIQTTGHKIFELDLANDPPVGDLLFNAGPYKASDEDFCGAVS